MEFGVDLAELSETCSSGEYGNIPLNPIFFGRIAVSGGIELPAVPAVECLTAADKEACAVKHALLQVRDEVEPNLEEHGLTFDDALTVARLIKVEDLASGNVDVIMLKILKSSEPIAKKAALHHLRVALEPKLNGNGLTWEDFLKVVDKVTVDQLKKALDDPERFLTETVLNISVDLAKKVVLFHARAMLEPELIANGLTWNDALTVIYSVDLDDIKRFAKQPQGIADKLIEISVPIAKKVAVCTLPSVIGDRIVCVVNHTAIRTLASG
jgi:hypothetical protein